MGVITSLFPSHRLLWISYANVLDIVIHLHSIIQNHSKCKVNHRIAGVRRSHWVSPGTTAFLPFCTCFSLNWLSCSQPIIISVGSPFGTCKSNGSVFLWKNHIHFSITILRLCLAFPKDFYNTDFIILECQTLSSVTEQSRNRFKICYYFLFPYDLEFCTI